MNSSKKLFDTIFFYSVFVTVFVIVSIGYLWINDKYNTFETQQVQSKTTYLQEQKALIENEVQKVISFIDYKQKSAKTRLQIEIKERVYEAHRILRHLYLNYKETKTQAEIIELMKAAIEPIRFNNGRGYFFMLDLNNKAVLMPYRKDLENKDLTHVKDSQGRFVSQEMKKVLVKEKEGYFQYHFSKPDAPTGESFEKYSFAKLFEPYGIYIGTGEYLINIENDIKQEVLDRVNSIRYGKNGYIFIGDYNGISLANFNKKIIGKDIRPLQDVNGKYFVQELFDLAINEGSGFSTYHFLKPSTQKVAEKISYVRGYDVWQWAIGTGVYLDEINAILEQKKESLTQEIQEDIIKILLIIVGSILAIFVILKLISNSAKESFEHFSEVFKKAGVSENEVDIKKLRFFEFKKMGMGFNSMIRAKHKIHEDLKVSNKKLISSLHELKLAQEHLVESEKMAGLGSLVAGVAHEINTPIGLSITGVTHLSHECKALNKKYKESNLRPEELDGFIEDACEISDTVYANLKRAVSIVKSFKRISIDQSSEDLREFAIKEYIEENILNLQNRLKHTRHRVNVVCDEKLRLTSYPGAFAQIITNFILNSLEHAFEKADVGHIDIVVKEEESLIKLIYTDDGKGIKKSLQKRIYEPFFTTNRKNGGSGLGLNIIYNIVKNQLHGTIQCISAEDEGTKFILTIPKIH